MPLLEKIFALLSIGRGLYGKFILYRMAVGVVFVISLIIVLSMVTSALMISGFYAGYIALLHAGLEPKWAALIIVGIVILTMALLIALTLAYFRHLRELPRRMLKRSPLVARAADIVEAFIDGLLAEDDKP